MDGIGENDGLEIMVKQDGEKLRFLHANSMKNSIRARHQCRRVLQRGTEAAVS